MMGVFGGLFARLAEVPHRTTAIPTTAMRIMAEPLI
jgi:hypothetical protein